ncbi:hypothetical protein FGU65_13730 [Methanoculleus sp. FWC-SCC1]|uniref:Uncharacterized protein n=1 Tax=Methanoculleus frigidifontis TaxID=2584085 RepID=A0ABT8MDB5_9EURY|nr:hypothetical protein [Methanoculleus sp. FWC-SCC1]MDN7025930.1 hypothetical protein [Methanoculleus sp. FWC-SCC1]
MERLNEDGQWIVLMGLLVAVGIFFLALIINQSALVGQTTSEAVLEFPKSDIRDISGEMQDLADAWEGLTEAQKANLKNDITTLSLYRKNAIVDFDVTSGTSSDGDFHLVGLHYNNGVTVYNDTTPYYY